jgi:hypothetical protein
MMSPNPLQPREMESPMAMSEANNRLFVTAPGDGEQVIR